MKYESKQQTEVPTPCPKCGGRVIAIFWDETLKFLKFRSWLKCLDDSCDYCETAEDFKKELLTV